MTSPTPPDAFPSPASAGESRRIGQLLRREAVGGLLLGITAVVAIVWANSPWADAYFAIRDTEIGYAPWHLQLSVGAWASDGLLAVFFFLVGLELKREFVAGDLRRVRTAIIPVLAAAGGVAVPALIYTAAVWQHPELTRGWAIPTATDIAFAVAVLALIGSHLPGPLRLFLLTLAVVDDFLAITIIAVFYTDGIRVVPLLIGVAVIALYGLIAQRYREFFHLHASAAWLILLPIGLVAWAFVHASGIHATIAGVALAFTIPVKPRVGSDAPRSLAVEFEYRFRPLSAGVAVPIFAFFSAGVALGGPDGFGRAITDPVAVGIILALVLGKPLGITATTWLMTHIRGIRLDPALRWIDIVGVGLLAGIGFTVSLLVTELSFTANDPHHDHAKVGIFVASLVAAALGSIVLGVRNRHYRRQGAAADLAAQGSH